MNTKQELRNNKIQIRDSLTTAERKMKSQSITSYILSCEEFQNADLYLLFSSFRSEVHTSELLQQAILSQKPVYLPKVIKKEMRFYQIESAEELEMGYQGIPEPKEEKHREFVPLQNQKLFVLVPGVVFDPEGGRIGYGGGFYDKFLQKLEQMIPSENLCKLAVAYQCQMVDKGQIPIESYDRKPDFIVTEDRIYQIG